MKQLLKQTHDIISERLSEGLLLPKQLLVSVYLHKIYPHSSDVRAENGTVSEGVTIRDLEAFILYFKKRNFTFIHDEDLVILPKDGKGRYVHLSFDDGYSNNLLALPVLSRYNVKATIYVCKDHIVEGKNFWWDVLYRERHTKTDQQRKLYSVELPMLLNMRCKGQYQYIADEFGEEALYAKNDMMRPLRPDELRQLSACPLVRIGNHTTQHQNLRCYTEDEIRDCLLESHRYIESETGRAPLSIAYPYGSVPSHIDQVLQELPPYLAFTVEPDRSDIGSMDLLRIPRFQLSGYYDIAAQCTRFHHNFSIIAGLKSLIKGGNAGRN